MTITGFLEARIAEDEAIARHAGSCDYYDDIDESVPLADERNHVLRHDPARVLRETAAKRKILAAYIEAEKRRPSGAYGYEEGESYGEAEALLGVVRALVAVHGSHPDFDPAWAG